MIAVAVGTLGVLWSITVWAVHSRKNTLGNFYRHGKPPRVDDLPPLDIAILSGYIGSPEGTFSILDPKPDPHQRQPRGDMLSWAVTDVNMWVKQSTLEATHDPMALQLCQGSLSNLPLGKMSKSWGQAGGAAASFWYTGPH